MKRGSERSSASIDGACSTNCTAALERRPIWMVGSWITLARASVNCGALRWSTAAISCCVRSRSSGTSSISRMNPVLETEPPKSGEVIDIDAVRSGTSSRTMASSFCMYSSMYW